MNATAGYNESHLFLKQLLIYCHLHQTAINTFEILINSYALNHKHVRLGMKEIKHQTPYCVGNTDL
jgi:hypothetical protein